MRSSRSLTLPSLASSSVLAVSLALFACGPSTPATTPTPPAIDAAAPVASSTPDADAGAPEPPKPKGLAATDNDAEIVAAAKKAMDCKFDDDDGFDGDCDGYKAWGDLDAPFADGKNDATIVNLLEDDDKKVRLLAAQQLEEHGKTYKTDVPLATRVLAVGDAEKLDVVCTPLGGSIGEMDLAATKLFDRIAAMARTHSQTEMRSRIVARVLDNNEDSDDAFKLTVDMLKDGEKKVRMAAVEALPRGAKSHAKDVCSSLSSSMANDADGDVAATAAKTMVRTKQCASEYDALLDVLDKRELADKVHWYFTWALQTMCEDKASSPAQRTRAVTLAKRVADDKKETTAARIESLVAVSRCDASKGWRAYVAGFKSDKDLGLKARSMLAPAPGGATTSKTTTPPAPKKHRKKHP